MDIIGPNQIKDMDLDKNSGGSNGPSSMSSEAFVVITTFCQKMDQRQDLEARPVDQNDYHGVELQWVGQLGGSSSSE